FGALDPVIRTKAQQDLLAIQKHLGTTIILVTHDMNEAFRLADKIAVMDGGRLLQHGTVDELVRRPASDFVEAMVGTTERPFRLLSSQRVADVLEPGDADGPAIAVDASLQDALADLIWSGRDAAPVHSAAGEARGRVTLKALLHRARGAT
ncbi:MAG TPA: ABC transporter ATP-binding protein, partial [Pseudorhizobium sp.]|nr:ABC transporter ATP-binding protein [Pseudorhizobium sp.]